MTENKDKQIEEMRKIICENIDRVDKLPEVLTAKGYRKASDVAEEIFEELLKDITHGLEIARSTRKKFLHNIEKNNIWVYHYDGEIKALEGMECLIAELKKNTRKARKGNESVACKNRR